LAKKAAVKKAAVKKAAVKKTSVKKTVARKAPAKKPAAGRKPALEKAPAKQATGNAARKRKITPEQALANTRALLEAKHEHDRQPPPWQALGAAPGQAPQPGFQSDEAAQKAGELHAGESRMQAIQGSVGTQGRHNQGKRDSR